MSTMGVSWRATEFALGVAVVVVLGLFLLPVVPITVSVDCENLTLPGCIPGVQSAFASTMYAYFGAGAVQVPGSYDSRSYCLMSGNPTVMCGLPMQRLFPCNCPCLKGTPKPTIPDA